MKTITRNRQNRDYDAFLDGEYVGSFDTYHDAEIALNELAYARLTH